MPPAEQNKPSLRARLTKLRKRSRPEVLYTYAFPTHHPDAAISQPAPDNDAPRRDLVPADKEQLQALGRQYRRELSRHKQGLLVQRLREPGQHCWVILADDGTPAGYCHLATQSTLNARINHMVRVAPHQAYFYDDYVFKKHRGKGLHTFATARRSEIAAAKGITEGLTTITSSNAPSIASYAKFGAVRRQTLVFLPLLGRTIRLPKAR